MADEPPADPGSQELAGNARTRPAAHDDRHELLIVALLDDDPPDEERAEAERLVASCPSCADLRADLAALVAATRVLPTPPRPRDFTLSVGDAARLSSADARGGELRRPVARLTGEMQVPNADHRAHDQVLVSSLLDRSADGPERERGMALVAACADCAALHRDLMALRDAARELRTPTRVRDFTLTAEDARRLRRTGWRRMLAVFGSTRDAFTRPLAIGLTTIGLAGLLVTTVPGTLLMASSSAALPTVGQNVGGAGSGASAESLSGSKEAPQPSAAPSAPGPAAAALNPSSAAPSEVALPAASSRVPAPSAEALPPSERAPSAESFDTFVGVPAASGDATVVAPDSLSQGENPERNAAAPAGGPGSSADHVAPVALASVLFAAGVGLFVLRWAGRRV